MQGDGASEAQSGSVRVLGESASPYETGGPLYVQQGEEEEKKGVRCRRAAGVIQILFREDTCTWPRGPSPFPFFSPPAPHPS